MNFTFVLSNLFKINKSKIIRFSENEEIPALNLEAWYELNQQMKFLARKEIFIRKSETMLNELREKIDSAKNDCKNKIYTYLSKIKNFSLVLIESQYMEFISRTKNEKQLIVRKKKKINYDFTLIRKYLI